MCAILVLAPRDAESGCGATRWSLEVTMSQSIQSLVEMQGRRWARALGRTATAPQPSIAIARLRYSGAHEVAQQVADQLGFGFFGSEIVDQIAQDEGVSRDLVAGLDERVQNAIERYVIDGFRHHQFEENDYIRCVTRVVTTLARRGRVVLLGRGAPAIVDPAHALRVLVAAPKAWRAARLAEMHPTTLREADERIGVEDSERQEFCRRSFGLDLTDPLNYDLVLNTASLGLPATAATIVEAFRRRFTA
jgi:cytidylate kinase